MTTFGTGTFGSGTFGDPEPPHVDAGDLALSVEPGEPGVAVAVSVTPGGGIAVPLAGDTRIVTFDAPATPQGQAVPVALDAPSVSFVVGVEESAGPAALAVAIRPGSPGVVKNPPAGLIDYPIVPWRPDRATLLPVHLLGIGPWSTSVLWRGAPNYGVRAGHRASVPIMDLPMAESKTVTLRLGEASEAATSHYFPRHQALVIEENITDLWWRRRDPRRGIVERIGRFNAATVDVDMQPDGGIDASVHYVDYQGLLEDRLIMQYLTPGADPPTTMWDTGTLIVEILRWAVPTNMGLDLTGLQAGTPDITAKLKKPFQLPLGTPLADVFKNLLTVSDTPWEWWVEMPDSDAGRPRLTLAAARGSDRGVTLFDIGGQGPIAAWSLQKAGDKYANALFFMGGTGGVVYQYDDQIAIYGQRDATDSDDTLGGHIDLIRAAAQTKLATLAAATPSYQVVLRSGFWEGRGHIDVGDWVTIRLELGKDLVGGKYRVSELEIQVDGNGLETVTLTLGTRRPAKDPRSRHSAAARLVRYLKKYVVPEGA